MTLNQFLKKCEPLINISWLNSLLGSVLVLYYGTLDIWGDDWKIISEYRSIHGYIYIALIIFSLIVFIIKALYERMISKNEIEDEKALKRFIKLISNIVEAKRHRFYEKATKLKVESKRINFFKEITHPQDQIHYIMSQLCDFFEFWGVERNQIEITVLSSITKDGSNNSNWRYFLRSENQKALTNPNSLMTGSSLAKEAIESGESIFLADLQEGVDRGVFLESARSKRSNNIGSIFCKPVTIKIQNITYKYVFSIVSYGKWFCSPNNEDEAEHMSMILEEIGNRVELELYLSAMRQHKSSN